MGPSLHTLYPRIERQTRQMGNQLPNPAIVAFASPVGGPKSTSTRTSYELKQIDSIICRKFWQTIHSLILIVLTLVALFSDAIS